MKQLTLAFFFIVQSSLVLAGKMENWEGLDGQLNDGEKMGALQRHLIEPQRRELLWCREPQRTSFLDQQLRFKL